MRKISHPGPQAARLIAKIVAARPTPAEEVPALIAELGRAFGDLLADGAAKLPDMAPATRALNRLTAAVEATEARQEGTSTRHATRRKARTEAAREVETEPAPAIPAAPRLMRRAEVEPAADRVPELLQPPAESRRRGVVRWFDARTGRGMLRVPGFGEDVALDPEMLQRAGLSRLYKGQEIEATVAGENGNARVVALALPGGAALPAETPFKVGAVRRRAKPVVVEMKRDALRRAAARLEAEHVLGSTARNRTFGAD